MPKGHTFPGKNVIQKYNTVHTHNTVHFWGIFLHQELK